MIQNVRDFDQDGVEPINHSVRVEIWGIRQSDKRTVPISLLFLLPVMVVSR